MPVTYRDNVFKDLEKFKDDYLFITDRNLYQIYGEKILASGIEQDRILILKPGEESKSHKTSLEIYDNLLRLNVSRKGTIIAFGGGVVGDITGFVASTFKRGINYIQIPTSLLSQVDSSVGGKTAINYGGYKNIIGSFYEAKATIIDFNLLTSLEEKEITCGLGEILKYGLIYDFTLFKRVSENIQGIYDLDLDLIGELVRKSVKIKEKVVEDDFYESGARMLLNFGHTLGHGIESHFKYRYNHGEAVILGMIYESRIAYRSGLIDKDYLKQIEKGLLGLVELPRLKSDDLESIYKYMENDKKNRQGNIGFILPVGLGKVDLFYNIPKDLILSVLSSYMICGPKSIKGEIKIPGDKSISHRALIVSSISKGEVEIENILVSEDVMRTVDIFRQLGVKIDLDKDKKEALVKGVGLKGLKKPDSSLDCGNSGTTMRLLAGLLSGQDFYSCLVGDRYLMERPMDRVAEPLNLMGACLTTNKGKPPIKIKGGRSLKAADYKMDLPSAQVKSALLLASLYGEGEARVIETFRTRDHTERILSYFEARDFRVNKLYVPGDISSASFFIVLALILKDSKLVMKNMLVNDTRAGIIHVLKDMGGKIQVKNIRTVNNEEVGDIYVESSKLKAIDIGEDRVVGIIDEVPILAVAAAFACGKTTIRGAGELRVKESDRIEALVYNLKNFGVELEEFEDGFKIIDNTKKKPGRIKTFNDHRIAMAFIVMALGLDGSSEIDEIDSIDISFPEFYNIIKNQL